MKIQEQLVKERETSRMLTQVEMLGYYNAVKFDGATERVELHNSEAVSNTKGLCHECLIEDTKEVNENDI